MALKEKEIAIYNAAIALFAEKGIAGTTTAEIARTAEVATGTLFNYFNTKSVLVQKLYLHLKSAMHKYMMEVDPAAPLRDMLFSIWQKSVGWALTHQKEFHFIHQFALSPFAQSEVIRQAEADFENMDMIMDKVAQHFNWQDNQRQDASVYIESFKSSIHGALSYCNKAGTGTEDSKSLIFFEIWWQGVNAQFQT